MNALIQKVEELKGENNILRSQATLAEKNLKELRAANLKLRS